MNSRFDNFRTDYNGSFGVFLLVILFLILMISKFNEEIKKEKEKQNKEQGRAGIIFLVAGIVALFALLTN